MNTYQVIVKDVRNGKEVLNVKKKFSNLSNLKAFYERQYSPHGSLFSNFDIQVFKIKNSPLKQLEIDFNKV